MDDAGCSDAAHSTLPERETAWHALPTSQVFERLGCDPERGLSDAEAARRLAEEGPNELRAKPPRTLGQMVVGQIRDPMILILIVAAALSAALGELAEGAVILLIVVANALIGIV